MARHPAVGIGVAGDVVEDDDVHDVGTVAVGGGDLILGDEAVVQAGQGDRHLSALPELFIYPHAGGHLVSAHRHGAGIEVARGSLGGEAGGGQRIFIAGGEEAHLIQILQLAGRARQLQDAAVGQEQFRRGFASDEPQRGGASLVGGGEDGGHLAVHRHEQGHLLARRHLIGKVPGAFQHREGVAQQRDGRGRLGAGRGILIFTGETQVGHQQGVGHAVVGDHVVRLNLRQADGLLILQNGVAGRAAGEPVEVGGTHPVHDHHRVRVRRCGRCGRIDGGHLAPQGEQGQTAAGGEGAVSL